MRCSRCRHENPAGQRFCGECGNRLLSSATDSERRQLTVMFVDLVGSTPLSTRLDPEELAEIVDAYQGTCRRVLDPWEGHVARPLGDGLLIYFGYPHAQEDAPSRAVRAALGITRAMPRLNDELKERHRVLVEAPLQVRIGIHTGLVVVGDVGSAGTPDQIALGETPNVAARLQGIAGPDQVVISETTHRLVPGLFLTRDLGMPPLKGVPASIRAYAVDRATGVTSRLDADPSRLTPLFGREDELRLLADAWDRAGRRGGQTILINGEAGVGKSRLLHAFRRRLAEESHSWFECRSTPYTQGSAFSPVIEVLERSLGFRDGSEPEWKLQRLERAVEGLGLRGSDVVSLVAPLLRIPLPERYQPREESPALQRKKTIEALVSWLVALANQQPTVMLIEDLHWCDASTVELVGLLLERSENARLLILLSYRPEFDPPWEERSNAKKMELARLGEREARHLIDAVTGTPTLAETLADQIIARADGIPLFLEELTQMVVESDRSSSLDLTIPETLQGSLLARLDLLGKGKAVAQHAAAIGREFSYRMLAEIFPEPDESLREGLSELTDAGLLHELAVGGDAYAFKHALLRDAAYQLVLKSRRRKIHEAIAETIESSFPERIDAEPELMAKHCEEAGFVDRAIDYYRRAGEQAFQRWANAEAINHLRKALELLEETPSSQERDRGEIGLQLALAAPLTASKGYNHPDAEGAYQRAHELSSRVGDVPELPRVLLGLGRPRITKGDFSDSTLELSEEALAAAKRANDTFFTLSAHQLLGSVLLFRGAFSEALEHLECAIDLYDPEKHRPLAYLVGLDQGPVAQRYAAWSLWLLGFPDRAVELDRVAFEQAREGKNPLSIVLAFASRVWIHAYRRELEETLRASEELIGACERFGVPPFIIPALGFRGWARAQLGSIEEGLADLERSMAMHRQAGWRIGEPVVLAMQGESMAVDKRFEEADRALEEGLRVAALTNQHLHDSELHRLRGELVLAATPENHADGEKLLQHALEVAREQQAKSFELRAATSLARLWQSQGRGAEVQALLTPIYEGFSEGFETRDLTEAKALLERD